ncbi:hypothetical protein [Leucobacter massiliensis]|uniref:Uncharacterized protein n=1 Tax=Leucobacter massiliensis TaxID=1686285 RepID=A0A2S9QRE6_9MICO|nr:hypothetical protein [Leucobacter massiliensis]PRI12161.1 hypothetical protein B4915_03660 [Leucobacter massiliensis]
MIIWKGWGIIPVLYALLAAVLHAFIGADLLHLPAARLGISLGVLLLLAAAATWFSGVAMNRTRPERAVELWAKERRQQLDTLVQSGQFFLGPGQPQPTSFEEAQRMSDELLAHEVAEASQAARNHHTLFFIPYQYVAFFTAACALLLIAQGTFGSAN